MRWKNPEAGRGKLDEDDGAEEMIGAVTGACLGTGACGRGVGRGKWKLYVGAGNANGSAEDDNVVVDAGNVNGSARGGKTDWGPRTGGVDAESDDASGSDGAPNVGTYAGGGRVVVGAGKLVWNVEKVNADAGAGNVVVGAGKLVAEAGMVVAEAGKVDTEAGMAVAEAGKLDTEAGKADAEACRVDDGADKSAVGASKVDVGESRKKDRGEEEAAERSSALNFLVSWKRL